jgi:hypothetical protein
VLAVGFQVLASRLRIPALEDLAAGRVHCRRIHQLCVCEPGTLIGRTDRRTRGGISQPPSSSAPYRRVWGQTRPLFTLSPLT